MPSDRGPSNPPGGHGPAEAAPAAGPAAEPALRTTLLSRRYVGLLSFSVLLGGPIAVACFFFVGFQHELQRWVWQSLPRTLGHDEAPWWWPLPALLLAGLILAPIVTRVPGTGGHVPAHGFGGTPIGPRALPGVVVAALATLPLGVVLGPEAPLMALGSGLALLSLRWARSAPDPATTALVATAGSTAAISTILGGPVVAAVLVVEAAALGGARLVVLLLPCLLAAAAGALTFEGFGRWTGLKTGGLSLTSVPPDAYPDVGDFLWGLPTAALVAVVITLARGLGFRTAAWTGRHTAVRTVVCALAVGGCLTAYALLTGRSPQEAALSGQIMLGTLAADPHELSVAALFALVLCKGVAYGIALGSLRGGPIFPAVLIGTAAALACNGLPGFGAAPSLAVGAAAATAAVSGLPLTSSILAILLLGPDAHNQMPLIVTASVLAFMVTQFVGGRHAPPSRN
ncbi:chloride channel protein [Streptomyces sp. AS58]|uniref:chloride channel protein n=1 Tax=Streptomyces sp. AS58 TaxID=1519489 RepID=UPI00099DBF24|nr:chloride channel protein [Streptomyces sp. AS58]